MHQRLPRAVSVGYGNESKCQVTSWYISAAARSAKSKAELGEMNIRAADIAQRYGINSFVITGLHWLEYLVEEGVLGPGKAIHSALPWDSTGRWSSPRS